ncbi:MarR family EPS-associated transcriptional regulator [Falsiruegeria litorea]|nr:MarR family EPS-associated transcriptional regulator [Falsiruegeria litorea]
MQNPNDNDLRVMRVLEQSPQMSQREIALHLKMSLGSVNYCLKALIDKGLVKVQNFRTSENRLAYAYVLTPAGLLEKVQLTKRFLRIKLEEYQRIESEIDALEEELRATAGNGGEIGPTPKG